MAAPNLTATVVLNIEGWEADTVEEAKQAFKQDIESRFSVVVEVTSVVVEEAL